MEGHLRGHIDIETKEDCKPLMLLLVMKAQSCIRIVKNNRNGKEKRILCRCPPFQRIHHSSFDSLSIEEASLACVHLLRSVAEIVGEV